MRWEWSAAPALLAGGLLLSRACARALAVRGLSLLPAPGEADWRVRSAAVQRVRTRVVRVLVFGAALSALLGALLLSGGWGRLAVDLLMVLYLPVTMTAVGLLHPLLLDLEERLQGPEWSRDATSRLWRWAVLDAGVLSAVLGGLGAFAADGLDGRRGGLDAALAFLLGTIAAVLVSARAFRALGTRVPLDEHVTRELAPHLADGPSPQFTLLRTNGHGVWIAFAVREGRRRSILVSEDLVSRLSRGQLVAVLLHELGHLRLRHVELRLALLLLTSVLLPVLLFFAGRGPGFVACASLLTWMLGMRLLFARQELAADRFAAERVPADLLGGALVEMTRAKLMPADVQVGMTHPSLAARLDHLGLDSAALMAERQGDDRAPRPTVPLDVVTEASA